MTGKVLTKNDNNSSILELIISNPPKKNAISIKMWEELIKIFKKLKKNNRYKCIIIKGDGSGPFCSGADINDILNLKSSKNAKLFYEETIGIALSMISNSQIPTISSIYGECYGAGLIVALSSDIIIASKNSKYAIPAAKLGITLNFKELDKISKITSQTIIKELLLTANPISSEKAYLRGIVNYVVKESALESETIKLATTIIKNSQNSNSQHLKMLGLLSKYGIQNIPMREKKIQYVAFDNKSFKVTRKL